MSQPPSSSSTPARLALLERVLAALSEQHYAEAARACRELALVDASTSNTASAAATASWIDHAELLDRLAQGKPVAAFMRAYTLALADELRGPVVDRLAGELEHAGQPLLAIAALDWLEPSSFVAAEQRRLVRELDPRMAEDELERAHSIATRIVEHFRSDAEAGDVRALRASAHALVELGRPKEALARVREALVREPGHLPTRLTEAKLLAALGEREAGRARLEALSVEFPTRAEPARSLAADYAREADDPQALRAASHWYEQALERSFAEPLVFELATLLERSGQLERAIATLEAGHARSVDPLALEDFARELARLQRLRGQPELAQRWVSEAEQRIGKRERGYAIAAIGLMLVLLTVLLVVALLSTG